MTTTGLIGMTLISTAIMIGVDISKNRKVVLQEIRQLDDTILQVEMIKEGKLDESNIKFYKHIHQSNSMDQIKNWRNKMVEEKIQWLQRPFYYQLGQPPIASFVDLYSPLT